MPISQQQTKTLYAEIFSESIPALCQDIDRLQQRVQRGWTRIEELHDSSPDEAERLTEQWERLNAILAQAGTILDILRYNIVEG